ncbi:pseudomonapepsin [Dictyobacter alpinus]|uniref:Pseudomonapepsin n=1 Tax=Dictyobacter alpinus TaxID=2014873 RepID=A0A402B148_9CHLR|nr:pseudomonapepsin [Dictyobacter alpinus]
MDLLLTKQADPTSPLFHHYLTPQEFKSQFGPTKDAVNNVKLFLQSHHLAVTSISSNNLVIHTVGSVAAIESTFSIMLYDYIINGRTAFAPSLNPAVPNDLAPSLRNIAGLNNLSMYEPRYRMLKEDAPPHPLPISYTPNDIQVAYDVKPLLNTGANGAGQTIALFELDGYNPADITTYLDLYKLGPKKFSDVLIDGTRNVPGSGAIETTLDMEMVSSMAPNALQKVYIGPNTTVGVNDTYNAIVTDNSAKVVSTSWGQCEQAAGEAEMGTLHDIFRQGAAQGQTFFAASGDDGAYDCGDTSLSVDSPANQPSVVGVGGTTLLLNKDSTYGSESAWSTIVRTQLLGGGGGLSSYFSRPAYQNNLAITSPQRMVPDVSANADPATGYSVYCSGGNTSICKGWITVGGTSASAPVWAGMAADINQYLTKQKKISLGNANSILYALSNTPQRYPAYHDVTTGTNAFYKATIGYDLATGLGTPDIWNIARNLSGSILRGPALSEGDPG